MKRGHYSHDQAVVPKRRVHVVAAVIYDDQNQVFLSRRPSYVDQGGLWEFPGGKLNAHETSLEALKRELNEELGIQIDRAQPLIKVMHEYEDKHILLDVWEVRHYDGEPYGREGQVVRWVPEEKLARYHFPSANGAVIKAAMLPHLYMVTQDESDEEAFLTTFKASLAQFNPPMVRLRAPGLSADAYEARARVVADLCRESGAKLMLGHHGSDIESLVRMVHDVNAAGLHLTNEQLLQLEERPLESTHWLAASVHDKASLDRAEAFDCDFAMLSCINTTTSHPDVTPLRWNGFQEAVRNCHIPVFALGGLGLNDVDKARAVGGQGIAAIRAFLAED